MQSGGYKGRRRRRFWEKNPLCNRCGVLTWLPNGKTAKVPVGIRETMATIGHKFSRVDPRRKQGGAYELLCAACNEAEGKRDEMALGLAELRRRSRRGWVQVGPFPPLSELLA